MEESHRALLRRNRVRLVKELRVDPLWDLLLQEGIFSQDMIEEIQGSGARSAQARQLCIDLETRGKRALPVFVHCLQETGQGALGDLLGRGANQVPESLSDHIRPVPIRTDTVAERPQEPRPEITPIHGSGGEKSRRNSETAYVLTHDPCGYCLIINNVNFSEASQLGRRSGSDLDCERMEKRFKSLRFEVLTRRDLPAQAIAEELQSLARRDHSSMDCCLVVILSHGCQTSHVQFPGGIFGTDGRRLAVEKMVSLFDGSHCPSLRGKPKIFFIQACGGEEKDRGFQVDLDPPFYNPASIESDAIAFQTQPGNTDEPDAIASLPTPSDILVSYSTFPGFVSWRDKLTGSWYIESLDQVLEQFVRSEDLLDMLLRVANAVSAKGTFKQMPGCFNFLRKRFFFMVR
nr:PREDICTED: caspase-9 [Anolis carolinensis]|eukprot:XP_008123821.1 PREDICTED: caspase-9 [Anolis carolinensis]